MFLSSLLCTGKTLHTSSSGGVVFSKDLSIHRTAIEYSDRGRPKWSEHHNPRMPGDCIRISHNFNTSELACAVGIASLDRISQTIEKRRRISSELSLGIQNLTDKLTPMKHSRLASPFLLPISFNDSLLSRKSFFSLLSSKGIPFASQYNCFAYDWPITKKFLTPGLISRIRRYPKKWIYSRNASKVQSSTFNLFFE